MGEPQNAEDFKTMVLDGVRECLVGLDGSTNARKGLF